MSGWEYEELLQIFESINLEWLKIEKAKQMNIITSGIECWPTPRKRCKSKLFFFFKYGINNEFCPRPTKTWNKLSARAHTDLDIFQNDLKCQVSETVIRVALYACSCTCLQLLSFYYFYVDVGTAWNMSQAVWILIFHKKNMFTCATISRNFGAHFTIFNISYADILISFCCSFNSKGS